MAQDTLLTNESAVRAIVGDNVAGKFIQTSIREAQDTYFRRIVGDTMLDKLKTLVADGSISAAGNAAYKTLLDRAQYLIIYAAIARLTFKVTFKIANAGVVKTSDENMEVVSASDLSRVRFEYQDMADNEGRALQDFMLNNWSDYPELTSGEVHRIHSEMRSSYSCGLALGGARGKRLPDLN